MKVMAIGAHFDDVELGCGGALLKHKENEDEILILVVTHSGYESAIKGVVREKEDALSEGKRSASYLGADLICLNKEPLIIMPNEMLVLEIADIVDAFKPDRVYTHRRDDHHGDHSAVGICSMRACRKCNEILLYRSSWYILDSVINDNYFVDISNFMDQKEKILKFFESEMIPTNYSWISFVKKQNAASGAKINTNFAETFYVTKLVWN